jgi:hypothetical protein
MKNEKLKTEDEKERNKTMNTITHIIPKLTAEQKELVRDVLEREQRNLWIDRLALTPPAGLGIRMSQSTLYRLKRQLELEEDLSDRDSIKEQARAVANEEQNASLESAAITLLREKAFALAASEDAADLRTASRIVQQLAALQKRNAKPDLHEKKEPVYEQTEAFRLKIARFALLRFGEIGSIRGNKALSEERKDQLVMERLFS